MSQKEAKKAVKAGLRQIDGYVRQFESPKQNIVVHFDRKEWTVARILGLFADHGYTVVSYDGMDRPSAADAYMIAEYDPDGKLADWRGRFKAP